MEVTPRIVFVCDTCEMVFWQSQDIKVNSAAARPCSDAAAEIERLLAENRRLHLQLMIAYSEAAEMYNDGNDARRG